MNDFMEKLSNAEGRFEIYVAVYLKYKNQYVFSVKDSKDWTEEKGGRKSPISAFGGKIESDNKIDRFLKDICLKETGSNIELESSSQTYIDYHHRLKKIPLNFVKGKLFPQIITIMQKNKYSLNSNIVIFNYLGNTINEPKPLKSSALMLAKEPVLVQMFKKEKTVQELKNTGAVFLERIRIPENLYLFPTGSLNSLLRYLNYEVF